MTSSGYLTTAGTAGMIDADTAGTTDFGATGPPLRLFGTGRPDQYGVGLNIQAPLGSVYTCVAPGAEGNFGARVWGKITQGLGGWACYEGYCRMGGTLEEVTFGPDDVLPGGSVYVTWLGKSQASFELANIPSTGAGRTDVDLPEPFPDGHLSLDQFTGGGRPGDDGEATSFRFVADRIELGGLHTEKARYHAFVAVRLTNRWPSAVWMNYTRSVKDLRELIESETDPEKLQALRDELTALESNNE